MFVIIHSFSKKVYSENLMLKNNMWNGNSNNSRFWTFLNRFLILQAEESKLWGVFWQFVFVFHCWAKKKEKGTVKSRMHTVSFCLY